MAVVRVQHEIVTLNARPVEDGSYLVCRPNRSNAQMIFGLAQKLVEERQENMTLHERSKQTVNVYAYG